MKTIDDVLNHPDNQVDPIITDYQEGLKKASEAWKEKEYGVYVSGRGAGKAAGYVEKIHEYQLEYNIQMHKIQIELELQNIK